MPIYNNNKVYRDVSLGSKSKLWKLLTELIVQRVYNNNNNNNFYIKYTKSR